MTCEKKEETENRGTVNMTRMAFETVETAENVQLQVINLNNMVKRQKQTIKEQQKAIAALERRLASLESRL